MKTKFRAWNAGPGVRYSVASRRREEPVNQYASTVDTSKLYLTDNSAIQPVPYASSPFGSRTWANSSFTLRMFTRRPEEYIINEYTLDSVELSGNSGRFPDGGEA